MFARREGSGDPGPGSQMRNAMRRQFLTALAIAAATAACAKTERSAVMQQGTAGDVAAVRRAIDSLNATMADAVRRRDSVTAGSLYDIDAMVMPEGMTAAAGRAAIQARFGDLLSHLAAANVTLTTQDVTVSGDLAVETGRYAWALTPKSGKTMVDSGKYVVVWKKQADGSWKIYRDVSNHDGPAATGHSG